MAEPHRDRILDALTLVLSGLSGTRHWGGGYTWQGSAITPPCQRLYQEPAQFPRLPQLIVCEQPGSVFAPPDSRQVSRGYGVGAGVGYEDRFIVGVIGYVLGDAEVPASRWLQRLWWDVILTLKANRTLGGEANEIEFGPQEIGLVAAQPLIAWFGQEITVIVNPIVIPVEG
jgi:hypothetical protein